MSQTPSRRTAPWYKMGLTVFLFLGDADAQANQFRVVCELQGQHGTDVDRVDPTREIQLLQDAIADTYPFLSPELREVADQITFFVNHKWEKITKTYMGWSAEDDPEYKYPDTRLYPEGTIKANFTEKFIRLLDLGTQLGEGNLLLAEGTRSFWRQTIVHELTHAWQYHTGPVRDLASQENACPGGLCDPTLLEETKRKVEYERQAFRAHKPYASKEALLALGDAIENYSQTNPELFGETGPYRLLAPEAPNSVVRRYLREEVLEMDQTEDFSTSARVIYEGQYAPAEIVWNLKKRIDVIEEIHAVLKEALPDALVQRGDMTWVEKLRRQWAQYMAGENSEVLKNSFPYLAEVEKRYHSELERLDQLPPQN